MVISDAIFTAWVSYIGGPVVIYDVFSMVFLAVVLSVFYRITN